jgi:Ca2+/Na+ antiporter
MTQLILIGIDLVAILILTFGLYFPRHRRRDLVVAFLVVNIGVLAVSVVLGSSSAGIGVGLGLFGVLSIIRLRSSEIAQHEVAYYFAALALGLFAGMSTEVSPITVGLMALLLVAVFLGDHSKLFQRYRQQVIVIDRAIADEADLTTHLEQMLGAKVHGATVERLDLVNDTTTVHVRYQLVARTPERISA